jgi:hypothetical protein
MYPPLAGSQLANAQEAYQMMSPSERRQLTELWLLAGEGAASDDQLAQLNGWLERDAEARRHVLSIARDQAWLAWNAADSNLPNALATIAAPVESSKKLPPFSSRTSTTRRAWPWMAIAASLLGFVAGAWLTSPRKAESQVQPIQATMVSSTGCIWGPGNSGGMFMARGAQSGDSLQLLEGIAEFCLGANDARLQMEGPASVVLAEPRAASMNYGKLIINAGGDATTPYSVGTSFGRVLAEPGAEIGLIAFGSKAEVHCFNGRVAIEFSWLRSNETDVASLTLQAGESLQFTDVGGAAIKSSRDIARRDRFTPQVSMSTDFLSVNPAYVRTVVAAKPAAYWRFEESKDGIIRNEMGPDFQGRVKGEVGWTGPEGNRALELGINNRQGSILADESWDNVLSGDFTIELWMKPSHQHLGSMVGFVGEFDPKVRRNRHGVLLEICGPSVPSWLRPKQLRFLHRSELTAEGADGVSCFSGVSYDVRRWQHVVAAKEGAELRLYCDGQLLQAAHDAHATPRGLHLVIGQLYTETVERFFIGQLDEVAIYGRALSAEEISAHHELLRPTKKVLKSAGQASYDRRLSSIGIACLAFNGQSLHPALIQEVEHASF